jgi:hypothetical protein
MGSMKAIYTYLKSLAKHKWYVGRACFKSGLYWRGIVHDLSKLSSVELGAYIKRFGGSGGINAGRDSSGFYEPLDDPNMVEAWKHHCHSNSHHWQYHCVARNRTLDGPGVGAVEVTDFSRDDIIEMLCDFWGASKAYKGKGVYAFWKDNKRRMRLSNKTRKWIDANCKAFEEFLNGDRKVMPDPDKKSLAEMTLFLSDDNFINNDNGE